MQRRGEDTRGSLNLRSGVSPGGAVRRRKLGRDDPSFVVKDLKQDISLPDNLSSDKSSSTSAKPLASFIDRLFQAKYSRGRLTLPSIDGSRSFIKWVIALPLGHLILTVLTATVIFPALSETLEQTSERLVPYQHLASILIASILIFRVIVDFLLDACTMKMLKQGLQRVQLPADIPRLTHAVVLCQYKEPLDVLEACVESLAETTLSKSCVVVFACEERDESAHEKFRLLIDKYGHSFQDFIMTSHILQPGEVAGKGSNENYAVRELYQYAMEKGLDHFNVMVTVCDADSIFDSVFLEQLEAEFCRQPDGRRCIYETPVNTYRNTPLCNLLVQLVEINRCNYRLFWKRDPPIAFSNYALTLGFAHQINYWDPGVIAEDVGLNMKAMCFTGEGSATFVRVWSIILNDSVCSMSDRWVQAKRHMWCIELIPWTFSLFPVIRLRTWLNLVQFILSLDMPGAVPSWVVLLFPQVWKLFALSSVRLFLGFQLAHYVYTAIRAIIRDMVMRQVILSHRKHYMHMAMWRQLLLLVAYPFLSPLASFLFYSCAIWKQAYHALFHQSIAYITAPKTLYQPDEKIGSSIGYSTEEDSFSSEDDELTVELLSQSFETSSETRKRTSNVRILDV